MAVLVFAVVVVVRPTVMLAVRLRLDQGTFGGHPGQGELGVLDRHVGAVCRRVLPQRLRDRSRDPCRHQQLANAPRVEAGP
jgi:hypothetical protein